MTTRRAVGPKAACVAPPAPVEFTIPAVPPSLNSWSRSHWSRRAKLSDEWTLHVQAFAPRPRRAIDPAIVTLEFSGPRAVDADNRGAKFVLDGLVRAGLLADDGPDHVRELRLRSVVGPAETRVRIEPA